MTDIGKGDWVERAARAIAVARGMDPDGRSATAFAGSPRDCKVWETLVPSARAAIAAIRPALLDNVREEIREEVAYALGLIGPALHEVNP